VPYSYSRNGYGANTSSTNTQLGTYATIEFLGGVTSGSGMEDTFSIPSSSNVTWRQTFLAADRSSWFWIPCDGFLGLAFSTIADANTTTMVETLMQDGTLDAPRFGVYYGKSFNDTGAGPGQGTLTMGGSHEKTYVEGDLAWVHPLQQLSGQYQLWRTNMVAMTETTGIASGGGCNSSAPSHSGNTTISFADSWVVFDTGAGGITVPPSQVEEIYRGIGMNYTAILHGAVIPQCSDFNASWSVTFAFGDYAAPTSVTLTGDQLRRPGFANGAQDTCFPPFDGGSVEGFFLFGTPFLHQLYAVYDFGAFDVAGYQPRVGFGQLKDEWKPSAL
jgi:saccharopepsin